MLVITSSFKIKGFCGQYVKRFLYFFKFSSVLSNSISSIKYFIFGLVISEVKISRAVDFPAPLFEIKQVIVFFSINSSVLSNREFFESYEKSSIFKII